MICSWTYILLDMMLLLSSNFVINGEVQLHNFDKLKSEDKLSPSSIDIPIASEIKYKPCGEYGFKCISDRIYELCPSEENHVAETSGSIDEEYKVDYAGDTDASTSLKFGSCPENTMCDESNMMYCSEKRDGKLKTDSELHNLKFVDTEKNVGLLKSSLKELSNAVRLLDKKPAVKPALFKEQDISDSAVMGAHVDTTTYDLPVLLKIPQLLPKKFRKKCPQQKKSSILKKSCDSDTAGAHVQSKQTTHLTTTCALHVVSSTEEGKSTAQPEPEEFAMVTEIASEHPEVSVTHRSTEPIALQDVTEIGTKEAGGVKILQALRNMIPHSTTTVGTRITSDILAVSEPSTEDVDNVFDDEGECEEAVTTVLPVINETTTLCDCVTENEGDLIETFQCVTQGKFPDPQDSNKYYKCAEDSSSKSLYLLHMQCPKDAYYDQDKMKCINMDNTKVIISKRELTSKTGEPVEVHKRVKRSCGDDEDVPASSEFYFEIITEKDNSKSDDEDYILEVEEAPPPGMKKGFVCKTASTIPDPDSCNECLSCPKANVVVQTKPCPKTQIIKLLQKSCRKNPKPKCNEFKYPKYNCVSPYCREVASCSYFACPEFGFFPDSKNNKMYFFCDLTSNMESYVLYHMKCPHGRVFDPTLRECCLKEMSEYGGLKRKTRRAIKHLFIPDPRYFNTDYLYPKSDWQFRKQSQSQNLAYPNNEELAVPHARENDGKSIETQDFDDDMRKLEKLKQETETELLLASVPHKAILEKSFRVKNGGKKIQGNRNQGIQTDENDDLDAQNARDANRKSKLADGIEKVIKEDEQVESNLGNTPSEMHVGDESHHIKEPVLVGTQNGVGPIKKIKNLFKDKLFGKKDSKGKTDEEKAAKGRRKRYQNINAQLKAMELKLRANKRSSGELRQFVKHLKRMKIIANKDKNNEFMEILDPIGADPFTKPIPPGHTDIVPLPLYIPDSTPFVLPTTTEDPCMCHVYGRQSIPGSKEAECREKLKVNNVNVQECDRRRASREV